MKRRVLIGQALVHKPPVVILDEPTAGVDVELRRQLWALIKRLHADGHTIVLTTHYLEEAEELCDRIAIINRGEASAQEIIQFARKIQLAVVEQTGITLVAEPRLIGFSGNEGARALRGGG